MKSVGKYFSVAFVVFTLVMTNLTGLEDNGSNAVDALVDRTAEVTGDEIDSFEPSSPIVNAEPVPIVSDEVKAEENISFQDPQIKEEKVPDKPLEIVEEKKEEILPEKETSKPQPSEYKIVIVRMKIPFTTTYIDDASLNEGEKVIKTKGVEGIEMITYEREYIASKIVGEKIVSKKVSQEAINEVILLGSKKVSEAIEYKDFAKDSFIKQNEYRKSLGIPELTWDDALYQNVLVRAHELTVSFSHTRPNGSSPFSVIKIPFNGAAENIAMKGKTSSNIGHTFTEVWISSKGHHDNIINSKYRKCAVAIVAFSGVYFAVTIYVG